LLDSLLQETHTVTGRMMEAGSVVVVGAGIIGTTSAFRILRRFPGIQLSLVADRFSPHTTSDIAAGWWEPHLDPDTDPALISRWAGQTYQLCTQLWSSASNQALSLAVAVGVDNDPNLLNPFWKSQVMSYAVNDNPGEMTGLGFRASADMVSHSFLSFALQPDLVLPVLYSFLRRSGVNFIERKVEDLTALFSDADVVINCTGLGYRELGGDEDLYPISGQVIRAQVPNLACCLFDNRPETWAYIIPNRGCSVLGSVDTVDSWDTEVKKENSTKILENCSRICPDIKESKIVSEKVGLRPCRRGGVRLQVETPQGHPTKMIIHNYGHGGSGVTLSWGCAGDVVDHLVSISGQHQSASTLR